MQDLIRKDIVVVHECPYCFQSFSLKFHAELKVDGLTNISIQPHQNCPEFIIFVDVSGKIRGTQTSEISEPAEFTKENSVQIKQESGFY